MYILIYVYENTHTYVCLCVFVCKWVTEWMNDWMHVYVFQVLHRWDNTPPGRSNSRHLTLGVNFGSKPNYCVLSTGSSTSPLYKQLLQSCGLLTERELLWQFKKKNTGERWLSEK